MDNRISIYADGACRNNQSENNVGAYGVVLLYKGHKKELSKAFKNTTNNKMELMAVIEALKALKRYDLPVDIYTDSQYVVNTMTMGWRRNANQELWEELDNLVDKCASVIFIKVKGHSGDKYNELADKLCNSAMDDFKGV